MELLARARSRPQGSRVGRVTRTNSMNLGYSRKVHGAHGANESWLQPERGLDRALAGVKIHAVSSSDKPGTSTVCLAV